MYTIFAILIIITSILLVLVVLVQNPKGGGLSSSFGGGGTQQLGGVQKTTDFLDKSTWTLATIMIILILVSNVTINRGTGTVESKVLDTEALSQPVIPTAPAQTDNNTATDSL